MRSKFMGIAIPLSQGLSLKIDAAPPVKNRYPTARLQKGFLLLDQGRELAEEAVGFGVPVLKQGFQTIFPGAVALTSRQIGSTWEVAALYKLNLVEKISRRADNDLENRLLYAIKNVLAAVIRHLPVLRGLLTGLSTALRRIFAWETVYVAAGFSFDVFVRYTAETETGKVTVEVDPADLPPAVTEVMAMNELGAHTFDRYGDSSGVSLQGKAIGCWDEVEAEDAWFESSSNRVTFRLGRVDGTRLYRGRELVGTRLAWAGFGYSFAPSVGKMRYEMRIERPA